MINSVNTSWLGQNWFKFFFLALLFLFLIFFSIFAIKYEKPNEQSLPKEPNIVYVDNSASKPKPIDLPEMIKEWYSSVVRVECFIHDKEGELYSRSGSGFLMERKNKIGVLTNKHIIFENEGDTTELCTIRLANNEDPYIVQGPSKETETEIAVSDNLDWAYIHINYPTLALEKSVSKMPAFCSDKSTQGSDILIMGYPSAGSDSEITATRGIVSGYEKEYYITDAKIGYGNSGGVAVKVSNNGVPSCLVGIPSFTTVGEIINLGRILNITDIISDPLFKFE